MFKENSNLPYTHGRLHLSLDKQHLHLNNLIILLILLKKLAELRKCLGSEQRNINETLISTI